MNPCRLCGANTSLVKSHIIPEAFFRELRNDGEVPLLVAGRKGHLPKRSPIGVYDSKLLCAPCEAKFSSGDSYGIAVLLSHFDHYFKPLQLTAKSLAFQGDDVDTARLLQFLVSVLWRASVSTQLFYATVTLGPLEEPAKNSMFESVVPSTFNAVLSRWDDADDKSYPTTGMMNPHRERWGDVNAYRLYLGKGVAYVKVDQRNFSEPFAALSLQAGPPCKIVNRRMSTSKDLKAMRKTVAIAERNRALFRSARRAA